MPKLPCKWYEFFVGIKNMCVVCNCYFLNKCVCALNSLEVQFILLLILSKHYWIDLDMKLNFLRKHNIRSEIAI